MERVGAAWCQSASQVVIIVCLIASLLARRPEPRLCFHHIWILVKPLSSSNEKPLPSFNMYLLVAVISQEHIIYLYADSDSNLPLMEIPMAGGGGAFTAIRWQEDVFFCREWMWKDVKIKHANNVGVVLCSSELQGRFLSFSEFFLCVCVIPDTCVVRRPFRFPSRDLLS